VIAGLDAYINKPSSGPVESALFLISDIFGWRANNARLYVDKLASEGAHVGMTVQELRCPKYHTDVIHLPRIHFVGPFPHGIVAWSHSS
jgi:hypothetical protein